MEERRKGNGRGIDNRRGKGEDCEGVEKSARLSYMTRGRAHLALRRLIV